MNAEAENNEAEPTWEDQLADAKRALEQARRNVNTPDVAAELSDMFADLARGIAEGGRKLAEHRAQCPRRLATNRRACETCTVWICATCGADTETPEVLREGFERPALCPACSTQRDRDDELGKSRRWLDTMGADDGAACPYVWADPARAGVSERLATVCPALRPSDPRRAILGRVLAQQWACVLSGPTGAYKSTAASYLARRVLERGRLAKASPEDVARAKGIVFIAVQTLERKARAWPLGKGECPEIAEARRATLLVLDDVGNEGEVGRDIVQGLVTDRYEKRPTWVTTGLEREAFGIRYGGNIERKLSRVWAGNEHVDTWISLGATQLTVIAGGKGDAS